MSRLRSHPARWWAVSAAIALAITAVAWRTGEWWQITDPSLKINLWTARAVLLVTLTLGLRGVIAVLPRMTPLRWTLAGFWLLYAALAIVLAWPGTLMSDSIQEFTISRGLVITTWFGWIYGLAHLALLDLIPRMWFLLVVQVLGSAAVFAYAGDVIYRRGRGARWPLVLTTLLLAGAAPVIATTILISRDAPFGVLHLLLALLIVDAVAVRKRATPLIVLAVAVLAGVLSVLRGDGVLLLWTPLLLLALRPSRQAALRGGLVTVALIVAIRVVLPTPLKLDDDPFRYSLTLRLPAIAAILADANDTADRRDDLPASDRKNFEGSVNRPFWSKTPEADLEALAGVIDLRRVEGLQSPFEIPAFWFGAYRLDATPAQIARFQQTADRLIRDNLPVVLASKVETFSASSGLMNHGFTGIPFERGANPFGGIAPAQRDHLAASAPWPSGTNWLARQLGRSATYQGLRPAGSALWWNLVPALVLLLAVLIIRRRWWPEALLAGVILARVPLVFVAAPAAQFKYYYSVYLGGIVALGLMLAAFATWRADRRAQPAPVSAPELSADTSPA
ncbi:MAG: hypothetical protein QM679_03080 [Patulibacter sp.]